jgi:uncharacterized protein YndB with AHSA1/START domain
VARRPDGTLEYQIRIRARAETVFAHFTDPRLFTLWLGRSAVLDPRPGGVWSVDVNGLDVVTGTYVVVEPYTRLVLTWSWQTTNNDAPDFESRVEVTFHEDGSETVVHIRHHDLPPDLIDGHHEGWRHYLARLATAAGGSDPGPDSLGTAATRHNPRAEAGRLR